MKKKDLMISAAISFGTVLLLGPAEGRAEAGTAAEAVSAGGSSPATSETSVELEEVTVTAQKRTENIQDVPVSVSTISATQLQKANIVDVRDLSVAIPTVTLTDTNGYLTASIRGVGGDAVGPGVENQVSLYIDDVYYGSPAGSLLSLNNIRQVDVLKGPQGTLFGRNATGGVVQITTRDPTDQPSGEVNLTYANFNNFYGTAYAGGALTDTLKADIALQGRHQGDGWGDNIFDGRSTYDVDYQFAARSKILFNPLEGTRLTLIADYSGTKNTLESAAPTPGLINGNLGAASGPRPDLGYNANFNGPDLHEGYGTGVSLKWDQDAGPLRLVNIMAYRKDRYDFDFDYDYSPVNINNIYAKQRDRQFSEEFQIQGPSNDRLKWVIGAYYFNARAGWDNFLLQAVRAGSDITVHNFQTTRSEAGFGQLTYEVLSQTNLTAGARYTNEDKGAVDGSTTIGVLGGGPTLATIPAADAELHAAKATYRASIDHRFNDELLAYVSYNTGFKSGGFSTGSPGSAPYLPEKLEAYEVGIKTDLLDRRLRINAASFYYDYTNIQVQQLRSGAIATINGAGAKLYGVDADISAAVTSDLRVTAGMGWTHPNFTSFPNCPVVPASGGLPFAPGSCAGHQIPIASDFVGNFAADYLITLPAGSLDLNANVYYNSGFFFTADNNFRQGAYALTGASATWTAPGDRFTLSAWGKNLGDKRVTTYLSVNSGNGTADSYYFAPRTYGVTLGYKF